MSTVRSQGRGHRDPPKANIPEVISSRTGAGPDSKERIDSALKEVAEHLGVDATCEWSGTFYQYANRLAHLYLLHELNGVDARLVFVYFLGDWHRMLKRKVDVFLEP